MTNPDGTIRNICVTPLEDRLQAGDECDENPVANETQACQEACNQGTCSSTCQEDADCSEEQRCIEFTRYPSERKTCAAQADCLRNSDCSDEEICHATIVGSNWFAYCGESFGELEVGSQCADDASLPFEERCKNKCVENFYLRGEELSGTCAGPCQEDVDCGEDQRCVEFTTTLYNNDTTDDRSDDTIGHLSGCAYLPGSHSDCETSVDCTEDEFCWTIGLPDGTQENTCRQRLLQGGELGEACNQNDQCLAGGCLHDWYDTDITYCTNLCVEDADCPTGLVCRVVDVSVPEAMLQVCVTPEDPRGETF